MHCTNLAAYTSFYWLQQSFQVANGTIQLADISQLNRQITIDPTGKVTVSDKYKITNNSTKHQ